MPLLQKGLQEMQHGNLAAAQADLESASHGAPDNPYVWCSLAEVYARENQSSLAADAAKHAEQTGAGNPVIAHALALYYARVRDYADAARSEEAYAVSPKADKEANLRAAMWYAAAGNAEKAAALGRNLQQDPDQVFQLAQRLLREQDFREAADVLEAGLQVHPNDPQLTLALGAARYGQRRFDDAISAFLAVIKLAPDIPQSYVFLGRMLDQAGPHLAEIVTLTEKWAAGNPQDAIAQLALAKALLSQNPSAPRAETLLRRSIELNPNNWESHYELGLILEQTHRYDEAAAELKRAIALEPAQAMPHYHLARVDDRLGKHEEAAAQRALHQKLIGTGPTR